MHNAGRNGNNFLTFSRNTGKIKTRLFTYSNQIQTTFLLKILRINHLYIFCIDKAASLNTL